MPALLKVISETTTLVETRLGLVASLLTNNYDKWTQDPLASWTLYNANAKCYIVSEDGPAQLTCSISKQFYLPNPAHASALTVQGERNTGAYGGQARAHIHLIKPDTSVVSLYYGTGSCGWVNYLSAADITSYLNQAGTYTLELVGYVQSGVKHFEGYDVYYPSDVHFGDIVFTVNCNLPGQPTSLAGHAENLTQVHLTWVGGVETTSYAVYYRKREFTG